MATTPNDRQSVPLTNTTVPVSSMVVQPEQSNNLTTNQGQEDGILDSRKQEIGDILHQIMNITDQSLDEAQARFVILTVTLKLLT